MPQEVVPSQGFYAQGYYLMGFHQNNPFQTALGSTMGVGGGSAEISAQDKDLAQSNSARTRSEGTISKTHTATTSPINPVIIESKTSESPDEPPNTQRKNVNQEFFMEDQVVPPSPTNPIRHRKHPKIQRESPTMLKEQPQKQQQQPPQQVNHEDYDNPNHLYAEINVKHRPQNLTRQGSEGTASLAMTSISSITGHGSLFAKDHDHSGSGGLSPLPGGLWRMGSTIINTSAAEENYFDYSNDETLRDHQREKSGMLERVGNAMIQIFYTTCQCFDLNGREPMSPGGDGRKEAEVVDTATKTLNEAVENGTGGSREPMFSSPMES